MPLGFRTILSQHQAGYLQAKGSYLDYRTKMKDFAIWFNRMPNSVEGYILEGSWLLRCSFGYWCCEILGRLMYCIILFIGFCFTCLQAE